MERYKRQIKIIGSNGQKLISDAVVLVIGAGGIGSPVLTYLAATGIGKLILVDFDKVELSNLHRQILFHEADIGLYKANRAKENLNKMNSHIEIEAYPRELTSQLALELFPSADLIIDGTDNFQSRYLINDMCVLHKKPLISCSVANEIIQLFLFNTKKNCYRCVYPEAPPVGIIANCTEAGILGTVTGIAGTLTANLAINYLINPESNDSIMRIMDTKDFSLVSIPVIANEACSTCSNKEEIADFIQEEPSDFGVFLDEIDRNTVLLVDIREQHEREKIKLNDDLFFPISNMCNIEFFLNYKEKKIIFYSASGSRARLFASELRGKGIDAYYLKNWVKKE